MAHSCVEEHIKKSNEDRSCKAKGAASTDVYKRSGSHHRKIGCDEKEKRALNTGGTFAAVNSIGATDRACRELSDEAPTNAFHRHEKLTD